MNIASIHRESCLRDPVRVGPNSSARRESERRVGHDQLLGLEEGTVSSVPKVRRRIEMTAAAAARKYQRQAYGLKTHFRQDYGLRRAEKYQLGFREEKT